MPIKIDWANSEQTAILLAFDQQWTWSEFEKVAEVEHVLMDLVDHRVDVIADMRDTSLPEGAYRQAPRMSARAAVNHHRNSGAYVLVGSNPLVEAFARVYMRGLAEYGRAIHFVDSMEDAYRLLQLPAAV